MYPDPRVQSFDSTNFIPVKIHIKEQPKTFERFGAQWTLTMQILDPDGTKRHQFEGFLPADDFLSQLKLGLAHSAFARQQWKEAESGYEDIVKTLPDSDAALGPNIGWACRVTRATVSQPRCSRQQKHSRPATATAHGRKRLRYGPSELHSRTRNA